MRRSIFGVSIQIMRCAVVSAAAFALLGCEDGPNQTYQPAPAGAGDLLNNGNTPGSVDPNSASYAPPDASTGTNRQILCDGPTQQHTWAKAFALPVVPPSQAAGLDLSGGSSWQGLTIEDAEDPKKGGLCQSTSYGDLRGDGTLFNGWGDNGEIYVNYRADNHKIISFLLFPGYTGPISLTARKGGKWDGSTYKIVVGLQVQKNNQNWDLHWATDKNFLPEASELYDAYLATFAPGFPEDDDCQSSRRCIVGSFGDVAYFYVPALASAIWVPSRSAAAPAPSIPNRIDQDLAKVLAYSFANPYLKLDAQGPVGLGGTLGSAQAPCTLGMGLTYGDFLSNCVKVNGDKAKDDADTNKLLGGLTHSTERFHFNVQGVDVNFTDVELPADQIIKDTDVPTPNDLATQFYVDQSTLGFISNDHVGNDPKAAVDNHGAGLVYLEYARLVQEQLSQFLQAKGAPARALGDAACLAPSVNPSAPTYPAGCTGFEGFISHLSPTAAPAWTKNAVGNQAAIKISSGYSGGLKPGHLQGAFCLDATGTTTGYQDCLSGDIFLTSFNQVLSVMANGNVALLPSNAQDVRFFFRQFVTATLQYLKVAGTAQETVDGVHGVFIDPDNLFFDSIGAGQFELGEYVDRSAASKTQDPMDIVITADVRNGIWDSYDFSRDLFRGESAMYQSMLEDQSHGIGQENTALLTNMFGSPLLKGMYKDIPDPANPTDPSKATSAYYCATHLDKAKCTAGNQLYTPPLDAKGNVILDESGRPLLTPYRGAIGSALTAWTLGTTPVSIVKTYDNIQQAMLKIPLHVNPYDQASDPPPGGQPVVQVLVPWAPKQPGIGFPIALTGTRDKFIETAQIDMSGNTITANIDYDVKLDQNGQPVTTGDIVFKAVETTDFLGNVFLCQDPATSDLLSVEMYTPVATILEWLAAHPGTYQSCQIIIRYSPYGNYADYITSLTNGVRLGITQGGGFGRVVDATLFTPGQ